MIKDVRLNPTGEVLHTRPVIAKDYCDFPGWFTDGGGVFRVKTTQDGSVEQIDGNIHLYDEVEIGIHRIPEESYRNTFAVITEEEYKRMMDACEEGNFDEEMMAYFQTLCKKYDVTL